MDPRGSLRNTGKRAAIIVIIAVLFSASCKDSKMGVTNSSARLPENLPDDALGRLSKKTIYFGHQSVGFNILDGVRDILKENSQQTLNIVKTRELATSTAPFFAHSGVGRNGQPVSKLDDFSDILHRQGSVRVDVALMKFCFVDFSEQTDVRDLFRRYTETFKGLEDSFPGTTFVHVTTPLTGSPNGFKWVTRELVKRLIGRTVRSYKDNRPINEFNDLIRNRYLGKEPVFDLAAIESTRADGTRVMNQDAGLTVYSLAKEYTFDGGHLNERGRRIVALELLRLLAALPEKGPPRIAVK
jgi:hypothetical protein